VPNDGPGRNSMSLLGGMIDPQERRGLEWSPADLHGLALHALRAPLDGAEQFTLGELLATVSPEREALLRAKRAVKRDLGTGEDSLPREVSKALYVAVVAKARSTGLAGISRLDAGEFTRLARWCLAQRWLPHAVLEVVRGALPPAPKREGR
jgi:hypothetical protein